MCETDRMPEEYHIDVDFQFYLRSRLNTKLLKKERGDENWNQKNCVDQEKKITNDGCYAAVAFEPTTIFKASWVWPEGMN